MKKLSLQSCMMLLVSVQLSAGDDNDLFSSTADLNRLRILETEFIRGLQSLAVRLEEEHRTINRFLMAHYDRSDDKRDDRGYDKSDEKIYEDYVSNPINALYMIKRLGVELPR